MNPHATLLRSQSDTFEYQQFANAILDEQKMGAIVAMDEGQQYKIGRAFARQLKNAHLQSGVKFKRGMISEVTSKIIDELASLNLDDQQNVNDWFHSLVGSV